MFFKLFINQLFAEVRLRTLSALKLTLQTAMCVTLTSTPTCADDYDGAEEYQPNEAHLKNCADVDEATNGCMKVKTQSMILGVNTTGLLLFSLPVVHRANVI